MESHSPFCLNVHRALRYAGLSYERRCGRAPADFAKLSPSRQVPVLLVDGEPVSDSTRILQRIYALTGAFSGALDRAEQAEPWLWAELADTAPNGHLVSARCACDENWPAVRDKYFGAAPWFVQRLIVPDLCRRVLQSLVARDVWRCPLRT